MTRNDVLANIGHTGRHMEARYAGNCEVRQAFF
jgi:hypothetical protein